MSTYQDEILNYLTKKGNFLSAHEIYQTYPEVKKKLIEQFWMHVKENLESLYENQDFKIELSENIFDTYSSLSIYKSSIPNFAIVFEVLHGETYYGLWINPEDKTLDRIMIDTYCEKIEALRSMKKNQWWLGYKSIGANFNSIETLKKILPENRMVYAEELAKMMFDLFVALQNDIKLMSKMFKK
jgi:hypothetical protein